MGFYSVVRAFARAFCICVLVRSLLSTSSVVLRERERESSIFWLFFFYFCCWLFLCDVMCVGLAALKQWFSVMYVWDWYYRKDGQDHNADFVIKCKNNSLHIIIYKNHPYYNSLSYPLTDTVKHKSLVACNCSNPNFAHSIRSFAIEYGLDVPLCVCIYMSYSFGRWACKCPMVI